MGIPVGHVDRAVGSNGHVRRASELRSGSRSVAHSHPVAARDRRHRAIRQNAPNGTALEVRHDHAPVAVALDPEAEEEPTEEGLLALPILIPAQMRMPRKRGDPGLRQGNAEADVSEAQLPVGAEAVIQWQPHRPERVPRTPGPPGADVDVPAVLQALPDPHLNYQRRPPVPRDHIKTDIPVAVPPR